MEEWLEEFLFRGRPPGSSEAPEFQVLIGQQVSNPFDPNGPPQRRIVGPLTPSQAASAGWDISDLIEGVNTEALKEVDRLTQLLAEKNLEIEALTRPPAVSEEDLLTNLLLGNEE